jgi:hypothetical protein
MNLQLLIEANISSSHFSSSHSFISRRVELINLEERTIRGESGLVGEERGSLIIMKRESRTLLIYLSFITKADSNVQTAALPSLYTSTTSSLKNKERESRFIEKDKAVRWCFGAAFFLLKN